MEKSYNIPFLQGYTDSSDQDFVDHFGLPQDLAFKPEMNLWMTYSIYLENKKNNDPNVEGLLLEQFERMRMVISSKIWEDMGFNREDGKWMYDDELRAACKRTYEMHK